MSWAKYAGLNHAHNGYIETYLNRGLAGGCSGRGLSQAGKSAARWKENSTFASLGVAVDDPALLQHHRSSVQTHAALGRFRVDDVCCERRANNARRPACCGQATIQTRTAFTMGLRVPRCRPVRGHDHGPARRPSDRKEALQSAPRPGRWSGRGGKKPQINVTLHPEEKVNT